MPGPSGDEQLLRASIVHVSTSQLATMLRDRRAWVRRIAEEEDGRRTHAKAEEVVCREPLRRIVVGFVTSWNRDRPPVGGQFAENRRRAEVVHVSALDYLATNSGVPRGTIENITRAVARSAVVPYDVADALVAAIGDPTPMYDGTLEPTTRSSSSCCSGSQTTNSMTTTARV